MIGLENRQQATSPDSQRLSWQHEQLQNSNMLLHFAILQGFLSEKALVANVLAAFMNWPWVWGASSFLTGQILTRN